MGLKEAALEAHNSHREREEKHKGEVASDLVRRGRLRFQRAFKFEAEPDLVWEDDDPFVDFELEGVHLRFVRQHARGHGWEEGFHVMERCDGCFELTPRVFVSDLRTLGAYLSDPPEWECRTCKKQDEAIAATGADLKLPVER